MYFRVGRNDTHCGKAECGKPVTARDKSSENCWFMDFNELNHSREVCAAKLKDSGETCAICATMVPKLQIMHHECPRVNRCTYSKRE